MPFRKLCQRSSRQYHIEFPPTTTGATNSECPGERCFLPLVSRFHLLYAFLTENTADAAEFEIPIPVGVETGGTMIEYLKRAIEC